MNEDKLFQPEPEEIRSIFDDPEEEVLPEELQEVPVAEAFPLTAMAPQEESPWEEPAAEEVLPEEPVMEENLSAEPAVEESLPDVVPVEAVFFPEASEEKELPEEFLPEEPDAQDMLPEEAPVAEALLDSSTQHTQLEDPQIGEEIRADETALLGFARHGDAEVDKIIQQTLYEDQDTIPLPVLPEEPKEKEEDMEEETEPPMPKGRPKRKKGYGLLGIPHVLATVVWLGIILLIGVTLGRMLWVSVSEVLAFGRPDIPVTVTISNGDNIETVASKLQNAGLIQYPELFKMYADLTDAQEDIAPGTFTLNTKYDYFALVKAMSYHSPARETVELVIPEGYTCAQIFAMLEENHVCTVAELEEYAANGEIRDRWFLEGLTRGDKYCLEGYLFPDTYEFYTNDEPGRVLGKFLDNFDNRFTDLMKSRIDTLNERMSAILRDRGYEEEVIEERKFTIRDIVIIASMIEKETANDAESYQISSVIYNRLTNPANFPFLNIDATLIYALGGNIDPETGKTKPLTAEDLLMEHPYNTYTTKGLIPGPISNPGRNSLNAALEPMETGFYFYVYNPQTYVHLFAKTSAEHEKNVNYVRSLSEG